MKILIAYNGDNVKQRFVELADSLAMREQDTTIYEMTRNEEADENTENTEVAVSSRDGEIRNEKYDIIFASNNVTKLLWNLDGYIFTFDTRNKAEEPLVHGADFVFKYPNDAVYQEAHYVIPNEGVENTAEQILEIMKNFIKEKQQNGETPDKKKRRFSVLKEYNYVSYFEDCIDISSYYHLLDELCGNYEINNEDIFLQATTLLLELLKKEMDHIISSDCEQAIHLLQYILWKNDEYETLKELKNKIKIKDAYYYYIQGLLEYYYGNYDEVKNLLDEHYKLSMKQSKNSKLDGKIINSAWARECYQNVLIYQVDFLNMKDAKLDNVWNVGTKRNKIFVLRTLRYRMEQTFEAGQYEECEKYLKLYESYMKNLQSYANSEDSHTVYQLAVKLYKLKRNIFKIIKYSLKTKKNNNQDDGGNYEQ